MPARLSSCHTAKVVRYVIEGHVPAMDVLRLLRQRTAEVGLAVPSMHLSASGMEGAPLPYETQLVARDGSATTFARH